MHLMDPIYLTASLIKFITCIQIQNVKLWWLYSPVCVEPVRNLEDRFSYDAAQIKAEQSGVGIKVIVFNISS